MDDNLITSVVLKVFPEGTKVFLNGKASHAGSRFWMIPGKGGEPRWIFPDDPKHSTPFLKQWRPYDFFSGIKWNCLLAAYRGKSLGFIPGVVPLHIAVPEKSDWQHLGWNHASQPVPVIYVGTPGPSRKAVLGLIDTREKKVKSIGKVPLGPSAGLAINHEVYILNTLAKEKPGHAPRSLFIDRKNSFTLQEFIPGVPTGRRLTEKHVEFLVDLVVPGETRTLQKVSADLARQINVLSRIDPEIRAILESTLLEADDPSPLPVVWEHGDFAPWNIKKITAGPLRAIDWEASSRQGLPLFDLTYFRLIQAFLFHEREVFSRSDIRIFLQYMASLGIPEELFAQLIICCLVKSWWHFYKQNNHPMAQYIFNLIMEKEKLLCSHDLSTLP